MSHQLVGSLGTFGALVGQLKHVETRSHKFTCQVTRGGGEKAGLDPYPPYPLRSLSPSRSRFFWRALNLIEIGQTKDISRHLLSQYLGMVEMGPLNILNYQKTWMFNMLKTKKMNSSVLRSPGGGSTGLADSSLCTSSIFAPKT